MPFAVCPQEPRILAAVRAGGAAFADASHLAGCHACALAVQTERWMLEAATAQAPPAAPSPASLMLRAQLRARRMAAERSLRPLEIWRRAAWAVAALVIAAGWSGSSPFLGELWASPPSPAQAVFAAGALILVALPVWYRLRRGPA